MADKNIQMKVYNEPNGSYDSLFPVTKATQIQGAGVAGTLATLDTSGHVPTTQLSFNPTQITTNTNDITKIKQEISIVIPTTTTWGSSAVNSSVYATIGNANISSSYNPVGFVYKDATTMSQDTLDALNSIFVVGGETADGSITLYLSEAPTIEFTYILKGV